MKDLQRFKALCKDPRIDQVSDERESASFRKEDNGDGIWLYLMPGWTAPTTETHCVHESKLSQLIFSMKNLEVCDCKECLQSIADRATAKARAASRAALV